MGGTAVVEGWSYRWVAGIAMERLDFVATPLYDVQGFLFLMNGTVWCVCIEYFIPPVRCDVVFVVVVQLFFIYSFISLLPFSLVVVCRRLEGSNG